MSSSVPPPKTRKDSTTVVTNLPPASKATPPSIPTPAPAAQGAAASGGPISSKIKNAKDIPISATGKTPKRQKSSRFHITERVELEKLPNLKGISKNREKLGMIHTGLIYSCFYSCGF